MIKRELREITQIAIGILAGYGLATVIKEWFLL
ncbi:hypothetical protein BC7_00033 [Bacillus phage BC-7]|nr:hypothetical protein BC7_00033 [Bacillus phage BC-7]